MHVCFLKLVQYTCMLFTLCNHGPLFSRTNIEWSRTFEKFPDYSDFSMLHANY